MKKYTFVPAVIATVVLMGAGCASSPAASVSDIGADNSQKVERAAILPPAADAPVVEKAQACPEGMKGYVSSGFNLSFCYPVAVNGATVVVTEESDGVLLSSKSGGQTTALRKIAVLPRVSQTEEAQVEDIASPSTAEVKCEALSVPSAIAHATSYVITGTNATSGDQDLPSVDYCAWSASVKKMMDGLGEPTFFFFSDNDVFYALSGEQDASLGYEHTQDFVTSIGPR
jgi:hypothetical protein